jgi:hypothetical protein
VRPTSPPRSRRATIFIVVGSAVGTCALFAAAAIAMWWGRNHPSDAGLVRLCRTAVTAHLRAPGSARWPGGESVVQEDEEWTVTGAVDSQNGFGALLRTGWECHGERLNGEWHVIDVDFGQQQ